MLTMVSLGEDPKMTKNCEVCNKLFETQNYLIKKGRGRFCSQNCFLNSGIFKRPREPMLVRNCLVCKKPFNVKPAEARKSEKFGRYCSKKCRSIGCCKTGEKSWWWRGGITRENLKIRKSLKMKDWRISVFKKDNWTCVDCGVRGRTELNAHHILPFSTHPELRFTVLNGVSLCTKCHTIRHGERPFRRKNALVNNIKL